MHNKLTIGVIIGVVAVASLHSHAVAAFEERPNILWITCEDMGPNLGCYGDEYARTPNLDRFAAEGVRYTRAYASASVCSPARSCIITGVDAGSLGTQHLRYKIPKPEHIRCFTEYLREVGYYCTNNFKLDYQFSVPECAWDESSREAHWRKRPKNKPFFSVFNFLTTHQSRTRYVGQDLEAVNDELPSELRHDPSKAPLPPYYPDTQLVRENIAAYYTQITLMDRQVGQILDELEKDGLAEDTIVFFFSDHGAGLPRGKRWLHQSGINVPFLIRCPEKYRHLVPGRPGTTSDRMISFVDLAPSMLNLAGVALPDYLRGRVFLGTKRAKPRDLVFASLDRVGEVILCSRTVYDGEFQYIRNFLPHRPRMPLSEYSEITPIRAELRRLYPEGTLNDSESWLLAESTPAEELYDFAADPYQMNNLAASPKHQEIINDLREKLYSHMRSIRDTGLLSESEMFKRFPGSPFTGMQELSDEQYAAILEAADLVGRGAQHLKTYSSSLTHADSAVRYWSAVGLAVLGRKAEPAKSELMNALSDTSPSVRIAAAEALCSIGLSADAIPIFADALSTGTDAIVVETATALLRIGEKARPLLIDIHAAKKRQLKDGARALDHVLNNIGEYGHDSGPN